MSIDFFRKLYRLFPDPSIHFLGQHGSNDLFVWEERFASSVEKSANVHRGDGFSSQEWGKSKGAKAKFNNWDGGVV